MLDNLKPQLILLHFIDLKLFPVCIEFFLPFGRRFNGIPHFDSGNKNIFQHYANLIVKNMFETKKMILYTML